MLRAQELAIKNSLSRRSAAAELKTRIVKLRWIGRENDALSLHRRVAELAAGECAALRLRDTD